MSFYVLPKSLTEVHPVKIFYDVDDILHNLTERTAARVGVDMSLWIDYRIQDSPYYTPEQVEQIVRTFEEPDIFQEMQFYPGAEAILAPRQLGAYVGLNTNSFTQAVADTKMPQLLAHVPHLCESDVINNICGAAGALRKELDPQTFIFVDDSPYNIARSPAQINVMMKKPYNVTPHAYEVMSGKQVFQFDTLTEINAFVYYATQCYMTDLLTYFPELAERGFGPRLGLMG